MLLVYNVKLQNYLHFLLLLFNTSHTIQIPQINKSILNNNLNKGLPLISSADKSEIFDNSCLLAKQTLFKTDTQLIAHSGNAK